VRRGILFAVVIVAAGMVWPAVGRAQGATPGPKLGPLEYEGWRQYSTHCARCHGQDVLGNPVAADLLKSVGPGGPVADHDAFVSVVKLGRPSRGMPAFASVLTDAQIDAMYAYVKGRADGKIPPGRPVRAGA
jgi:mono/diheme cytochrome c family protein